MTVKYVIHATYRKIFLIRTTVGKHNGKKNREVYVENGLHYEMDFLQALKIDQFDCGMIIAPCTCTCNDNLFSFL